MMGVWVLGITFVRLHSFSWMHGVVYVYDTALWSHFMRTTRFLCSICLASVLTLSAGYVSHSAHGAPSTDATTPTMEEIRLKMKEHEAARAELAKELAALLEEGFPRDDVSWARISAIQNALNNAGKWHMAELAPLMIKFLDSLGLDMALEETHFTRPSEILEGSAKDALVSLGDDAIGPILDAVKSKDRSSFLDHTLPNAGEVLARICGSARAREVVNAAINDEHDPAKKARLENFLNYIPTEAGSPAPTEETPAPAPMPEAHPSPATQEKPATEPTEEAAPPAQTVSPAPAAGFPWYASGIIGLVLGAAATFALTRKK